MDQTQVAPKRAANTTEIKEVIKLLGDGIKLAGDLSDGLDGGDLFDLVAVARDLPPALKDVQLVWPEFKALDDAGRAELVQFTKDNITLKQSVVIENWIETVMSVAIGLSALLNSAA
jgi:hypothetical protein